MSTPAVDDPRLTALKSALHAADLQAVTAALLPLSPRELAALRRSALPYVQEGLQSCRERIEQVWQVPAGRALVVGDAFLARLKKPRAGLQAYRLAAVGLGLKK